MPVQRPINTGLPTRPSVTTPLAGVPLFFPKGDGDITWVCWHCGTVLADNMRPRQIQALSLDCVACGARNGFED